MRRRRPRVWIGCCDRKQVAHQFPRGSGDYCIDCPTCCKTSWATLQEVYRAQHSRTRA